MLVLESFIESTGVSRSVIITGKSACLGASDFDSPNDQMFTNVCYLPCLYKVSFLDFAQMFLLQFLSPIDMSCAIFSTTLLLPASAVKHEEECKSGKYAYTSALLLD